MQQKPPKTGRTTGKMPIVVDDRERHAAVVTSLSGRSDVELSVRRLSLGDYLVVGRLVVERKTVQDFVWSIRDGRLFRQAYRLAEADRRACLILEGSVLKLPRLHLSRAS